MDVKARYHRMLAKQLGHPAGLVGRYVGRRLNQRNRSRVAGAVEALAPGAGSVVADIGFGGGVGLELLLGSPAQTVHGVEISSEMLRAARRRFAESLAAGRLVLVGGSLTRLPLPDASVDGLITINTIYFVDDLPAAAAELARVLKPGGRAVIGIGDPEVMRTLPPIAYGFHIRSVQDVTATVVNAGLVLADHQRLGQDGVQGHLLVAVRPTS